MEQIETQASDLRFLAQAPVALSDTASVTYDTPQPRPHASPGSATFGDNSALEGDSVFNANKRKSVDDGSGGTKQTRSKRNRYISIACNECKRRKIKCNGETPCQRCGNLNLACLYAPNCCSNNFKDSDEFKQIASQLSRLQDEVNWLNQTIRSSQNEGRFANSTDCGLTGTAPIIAPSPSQSSTSVPRTDLSLNKQPTPFQGPTSMGFNLDVANATIANMGYRSLEDGGEDDMPSGELPFPLTNAHSDPIFEFDKDEMVRLCQLHDDEIGIMYPVLNIQTVISHARTLAPYIESVRNQRSHESINDNKTLQLKMVLCCALVVEGHGTSDKAARLYNSMENVMNRKLMSDPSEVANLPLLALLAGYRFLSNDDVLAWRVMGHVVRLCLELGMHHRRGLMRIQSDVDRKNALNSFWSAFVLDRRWAFGTGLPYAITDEAIDPHLPLPDDYPYLTAMISYSRLGAKVWREVSYFGSVLEQDIPKDRFETLDQEVYDWYEELPHEVKMEKWDSEIPMAFGPSYNVQRLKIWTYLRFNQIRIWLYTPILHSATSIMVSPILAQRVVDLAKDTIRFLSHINSTSNLYRKIQVFYHQFLSSAIAVVFLASVHAPVRFSAVCREEFYMALDLIKDLSSKSWVSQRLWRTIRALKDVAPRFGLNPDDDPHSTAALGMIGLARGHVDPIPISQRSFQPLSASSRQPSQGQLHDGIVDKNGERIQNELSRVFEGYVGLNGFRFGGDGEHQVSQNHTSLSTPDPGNGMCSGSSSGTLFQHFREMF